MSPPRKRAVCTEPASERVSRILAELRAVEERLARRPSSLATVEVFAPRYTSSNARDFDWSKAPLGQFVLREVHLHIRSVNRARPGSRRKARKRKAQRKR